MTMTTSQATAGQHQAGGAALLLALGSTQLSRARLVSSRRSSRLTYQTFRDPRGTEKTTLCSLMRPIPNQKSCLR